MIRQRQNLVFGKNSQHKGKQFKLEIKVCQPTPVINKLMRSQTADDGSYRAKCSRDEAMSRKLYIDK